MAPLAAPFKPRDADLFAIVSGFDSAYSGYAEFQSGMERYWCLRWLAQEQARQVDAVVLKDEILRLVDIPLVIRLPGMPQVARGLQVKLDLLRWDEVDLTIEARLLDIPVVQPAGTAGPLDALDDEEEAEAMLQGMEDAAEAGAEENAEAVTQAPQEDAGNGATTGTASAAE